MICVLAGCLSGAGSFEEIQSRISSFTLKNGMTFIVMERHQTPVASFLTYADVGSVQEVKGITGLAHIFEHMAFKGSPALGGRNYEEERHALDRVDQAFLALRDERRKGAKADAQKLKDLEAAFQAAQEGAGKFVVKNEYGEAIERAGGRDLNAGTAWDWTRYFFSLPSNSAELWFYLESERFLRPVMREFYKEKDVVMEERRMRTESQPIGKLVEESMHAAFKAHPYGEPVVGHMSDLKEITRADAEAFFKKYYQPGNLVSVIVGDVDPKRMRALAETYFGRIPSGPKPEPLRTVEPPQEGEYRVTLRLQSERFVLMGYHKPDGNHPDDAVYRRSAASSAKAGRRGYIPAWCATRRSRCRPSAFPICREGSIPVCSAFIAVTAPGHENQEIEKAHRRGDRAPEEGAGQRRRVGRRQAAGARRHDQRLQRQPAASQRTGRLAGADRRLAQSLLATRQARSGDARPISSALPSETFAVNNRTIATIEPLRQDEKQAEK